MLIRATGGTYRVVVRGSGVYLFAGGNGNVTLRGSSVYPRADGTYSVDGRTPRSLPAPGQPGPSWNANLAGSITCR